MPEEFQYDVFLSHSAKDKAVVREVAARLKKDGLRVWWDEEQIKPGDSIPAKIEDGLEQSRVLVLCMSANAFGSDWAQLEAGTFRFRDPLNQERRFIPLRLDDAPIKGSLAQFLYINWLPANREQEYVKLLEAGRPSERRLAPEYQEARDKLLERIVSLGHTACVSSVAWSPDGQHALSGAADHTVRLWEVASRCRPKHAKKDRIGGATRRRADDYNVKKCSPNDCGKPRPDIQCARHVAWAKLTAGRPLCQ